MATTHSNSNDAFTPSEFGKLLNSALQSESIALQSTTVVPTSKVSITFPIWDADPGVNWLAELATITATDGATDGVTVTPSKVGGITRLSSELANDSSPDVAQLAVNGLVNQIAFAVDKAFAGNTQTNGPAGLQSIEYSSVIAASITNEDPFLEAIFAAKAVGATLTSWVMHPDQALVVAKLKKAAGSNESLLAFTPDGMSIAGLPVFTLPAVDADTLAWGIPQDRVVTVVRQDAEVSKSTDSGFYNDAVDVRALTRVGIGFLHEEAVIRIHPDA